MLWNRTELSYTRVLDLSAVSTSPQVRYCASVFVYPLAFSLYCPFVAVNTNSGVNAVAIYYSWLQDHCITN